jgi:serine/threonine-protein kinase
MPQHASRIGKYEILAEIGRGGMGTVYRARDPVLDRIVALKTMAEEMLQETGMRERFLREARSAARLQHPNIVTIFEFGEVEGAPFIAMEFLEGDNLGNALAKGRLKTMPSRLGVVGQICDGLAYAHRHGVIHRDVKPANVTLLPSGTAKLVDFGIARLEGGTMATRTGQIMGTPSYMAPELFLGQTADHRIDEWAVGVILYELITDRLPFDADTVPALMYQIIHAPAPAVGKRHPGLPASLVAVLDRALAKDPRDRFGDLEEMAKALRAVRMEMPTVARVEMVPAVPAPPGIETDPTLAESDAPTVVSAVPGVAHEAPRQAASMPSPLAATARRTGFLEDGLFGEARRVQVIALSPDGSLLAAGGTDGSVRIWDLATRMKVATLRNRDHMRSGHGSITTCLAFSENGELLASGHLDGAVYLWEMAAGLELDVKLHHEGAVGGVALPRGGTLLVSAGADAILKFWELLALRKGDARRTMRREPDGITCLVPLRGGDLIVTGHVNHNLRVHDVAAQRVIAMLHGQRAPLSALAASEDGDLVAVGARDGSVRVHRWETREQVAAYQEHTKAVSGLVFLPGSGRIASVGGDNAIVIWDITEPEVPRTLAGTVEDAFISVAVSPDGRKLVAALADGRFRVWLMPD